MPGPHDYVMIPKRLMADPDLTSVDRVVWIALSMQREGATISQAEAAAQSHVSLSTLKRSLKRLSERGWMRRQERYREDGGRMADDYVLVEA